MGRFIECREGVLINTDQISRVERGFKKNDDCTIYLINGNYLKAPCYVWDHLSGRERVVQLIPAAGKYEIECSDDAQENGGKPWLWDCEFLAVCANGEIRPVGTGGGYFDFDDAIDNYLDIREKGRHEQKE